MDKHQMYCTILALVGIPAIDSPLPAEAGSLLAQILWKGNPSQYDCLALESDFLSKAEL